MQYRRLGRTGLDISVAGFGASPLGDVFGVTDPQETVRAVTLAIEQGINFFDVSPYYGLTLAEKRLGTALRGHRDEVVLCTKCGRYGADEFDFSRTRIAASIEESLQRLQTDHVDILLAHDIEFGNTEQILSETIPAMRDLQKQGKARWIGISGYPLPLLRQTAESVPVDVILSYCHYNPLNTELQSGLMDFATENGIGLINASPLHMGLLSGRVPPAWHPAPPAVRAAGERFLQTCRAYGANPAMIALRFCIEQPLIATTLIGMATCEEVQQNLQALDTPIPPPLRQEIEVITRSVAGIGWTSGPQAASQVA